MRRMLVVEDDRDVSECLVQFFSGRGFEVGSAFSGEEALDRLAQNQVEVVLLDILLPGLTGLEVLRRLKQLQPQVKVVMVSGLDHDDLRWQARRYGASDYVTKPFDFTTATWAAVLAPV